MYDLHIHSNKSDATWGIANIVDYSISQRLKAIAICDHDSVAGIDEAICYAQKRIQIIPAVEISTTLDFFNQSYEFHILGYFIDYKNKSLIQLLAKQRRFRYEQYKKILANIKDCDNTIKLEIEDFYDINSGSSLGMSHLTRELAKIKQIDEYQAYKNYICQTSKYYVSRTMVSLDECIKIIHQSNGLAFLAHPGDLGSKIKPIIVKAKKFGIDGIEIYHSYHCNYLTQYYKSIAKEFKLLYSGGSDCHGPYENFEPLIGKSTLNEFEFNSIVSQLKTKAKTN